MPASDAAGKIEFSLGTITKPVMLKIKALLPPLDPSEDVKYKNSATIHWDGGAGPGVAITVGTGYNALQKKGTRITTGSVTEKTQDVEWSIKADAYGDIGFTDMVVYDLLVYGDKFENDADYASIGLTKVGSYFKLAAGSTLTLVSGDGRSVANIVNDINTKGEGVAATFNHKYVTDSYNSGHLDLTVLTVKDGGKAVADLLVMTPVTTRTDSSDRPYLVTAENKAFGVFEASFRTKCLDPAIFLNTNDKDETLYNTATLYSANVLVNVTPATVNFKKSTVGKYAMTVAQANAYKNGYALTNAHLTALSPAEKKLAFDYATHSTLYTLDINPDNHDLTDSLKYDAGAVDMFPKLGNVVVTDTLPLGWELITGGKLDAPFRLYEKSGTDGVLVDPDDYDDILEATNGKYYTCVINDTTNRYELTFTFTELNKNYIIVFEAGMTEDFYEGYFRQNVNRGTSANHVNDVKLVAGNVAFTGSATITIPDTLLTKSAEWSKADNTIEWTVKYDPKSLNILKLLNDDGKNIKDLELTDTMSPSIVPFFTTVGEDFIVDTTKFAIYVCTGVKPDGTYTKKPRWMRLMSRNISL